MASKFVVFSCLVAFARASVAPAQVIAAAPVAARLEEFDPLPQYRFGYDVADSLTGDYKSQSEQRNGDLVQGQYSLVEPDGTRRVVDYAADSVNGFNAVVRKEPLVAPAPAVAVEPAVVAARYAVAPARYAVAAAPARYAVAAAPVAAAPVAAAPVVAKYTAAYTAPVAYNAPVAYASPVAAAAVPRYAAYTYPATYAGAPVSAAYTAYPAPVAPVARLTASPYTYRYV